MSIIEEQSVETPEAYWKARDEEQEAAGPWFVHLFDTGTAYGGPEEGGWWYATGNPSSDVGHGSVGPMGYREAIEVRGHLQAFADAESNDRRGCGSYACYQRYEWQVSNERQPQAYPESRPHYC